MALIDKLTNIANAIRSKTGGTEPLTLDGMAEAINGISGGGGFPNGTKWTQSNITDVKINDIKYANGHWIACGIGGLYHSTNGKTWELCSLSTQESYKAHYANNTWVVVTHEGVYKSNDIDTWSDIDKNNIINAKANVSEIYYACGLWAICELNTLYISTDLDTWTPISVKFKRVLYANGIWVGVGNDIYTSANGTTWNKVFEAGLYTPEALVYANNLFVTGDGGTICYSSDGTTWSTATVSKSIKDIRYGNGVWVASYMGVYYSLDGKVWTEATGTSDMLMWGLAYSNGLWVLAGNEKAYYSIDGKVWQVSGTPNAYWRYITDANGIRVAGAYPFEQGLIYSVTWEA